MILGRMYYGRLVLSSFGLEIGKVQQIVKEQFLLFHFVIKYTFYCYYLFCIFILINSFVSLKK